jgi:hypothetical protein
MKIAIAVNLMVSNWELGQPSRHLEPRREQVDAIDIYGQDFIYLAALGSSGPAVV